MTSLLKLPSVLADFTSPELVVRIEKSELVFTRLSLRGDKKIIIPLDCDFAIGETGDFALKIKSESGKLQKIPFLPNVTCRKMKIIA